MVKILHKTEPSFSPRVSLILLDWSVRDSAHFLDYLEHQDVPRDRYEVIWIEYYDREWQEIELRMNRSRLFGTPSPVDQWVVMGMPRDVYYHKHLMYNLGIVASRGEITVICDSDAFCRPGFIRTIMEFFDRNSDAVLHLDELRSADPRFYPFNYPSFEEVLAGSCVNSVDGKPRGLVDHSDPLHLPNYGACFCARREDLIAIGGADEHLDYLGHICGPYEMTFRLKQAGKREVWHPEEWLYHCQHPGTDGRGNCLGPHDGRNVSTTALEVLQSGRVLPLLENPVIRRWRLQGRDPVDYAPLLEQAIPARDLERWKISALAWRARKQAWGGLARRGWGKIRRGEVSRTLKARARGAWYLVTMTFLQLRVKYRSQGGGQVIPISRGEKLVLGFRFLLRMLRNNYFSAQVCARTVRQLKQEGTTAVALFGDGDTAALVASLARCQSLELRGIFSNARELQEWCGISPGGTEQRLLPPGEKIIIASFAEVVEKYHQLRAWGVDDRFIAVLG